MCSMCTTVFMFVFFYDHYPIHLFFVLDTDETVFKCEFLNTCPGVEYESCGHSPLWVQEMCTDSM